jgi:hypothetical protein
VNRGRKKLDFYKRAKKQINKSTKKQKGAKRPKTQQLATNNQCTNTQTPFRFLNCC